jgi:hypothetical protein
VTLKSFDPRRQPSGNPKLAAALERFAGEPSRRRRAELLESLLVGPLLVAIDGLPPDFDPDASAEGRVRFITAERQRGGTAVCAFSGIPSLARKAPAAIGLAVDPTSLLSWIVEMDMEGLLLDPRGSSAFVSNDDARNLLGLPRRSGRGRSVSLGDEPNATARAALESLLEDGAPNAETTLLEPRTGKCVLFRRADGDALMMVLARAPLAEDERARAEIFFQQLAGDLDDLPPADGAGAELPSDYIALFTGDTKRPAEAAVKVFAWVFGFPPGFALEVRAGAGIGVEAQAETPVPDAADPANAAEVVDDEQEEVAAGWFSG